LSRGLDAFDRRAEVVLLMNFGHIGELGNRLAGIEHRPRPHILAPLVQIRHAGVRQTAVKQIRAFMKLLHGFSIAGLANIMAA